MSMKNQLVYIQFHPLAYTVKLNIELSMAALIAKLVRGVPNDTTPEQIRFFSLTTERSDSLAVKVPRDFQNSYKNYASEIGRAHV